MANNRVVKAGIGYTIGNYLLKGLNFLTIPVFSRLLSTADYGIYNTFAAYESILFVFIGLAIHTSYKNARYKYGLVEEGTEKGRDYHSYVSVSMIFLCASLAVLLIVANIFSGWLCRVLDLDLIMLNSLILFSFASAVISCYNADAGIQYRYKGFLKVSAVNAIGSIGLSLLLICTAFSGQRYMGRVLGATIPAVFVAIAIIITFLRRAKPKNAKPFLKWGLGYSAPITPHGISQVVLSQFDRIMIKDMTGNAQAGIYSFAFNINLIITVTVQSLDTVWSQWFYEKMNIGDLAAIKKRSSQYIIGMFILIAGVLLLSPEITTILGAKAYWDAKYCVIPIIAGAFFAFLYTLPSCVEYYREKTKLIAAGTVSAAVLNIVLNYFCIKKYGYVAAAYTTLVTYFLYFLFHYIIAWKIEKKCLFSTSVVVVCTLGILAVSAFTLVLIESLIARWALALVFGAAGFVLEERWLGFAQKAVSRLKGKK